MPCLKCLNPVLDFEDDFRPASGEYYRLFVPTDLYLYCFKVDVWDVGAKFGFLIGLAIVHVLLKLTTTCSPVTDFGYLLHRNPARLQSVEVAGGVAHVCYIC